MLIFKVAQLFSDSKVEIVVPQDGNWAAKRSWITMRKSFLVFLPVKPMHCLTKVSLKIDHAKLGNVSQYLKMKSPDPKMKFSSFPFLVFDL